MNYIADYTAYPLILLQESWEYYADLLNADNRYRDYIKRLRHDDGIETREEAETRWNKYYKLEGSLRRQHLDYINLGYFDAYGIEISSNGSSERRLIQHEFFDRQEKSFKEDWEGNSIQVHGLIFIGIKIKPSQKAFNEISGQRETDTNNPSLPEEDTSNYLP